MGERHESDCSVYNMPDYPCDCKDKEETPETRRAKLEAYRQNMLATTTPEQRSESMRKWLDALSKIGELFFPNAREFTKEESEAHNRLINERSVVVCKLYEMAEKPVTPWVPRDWGAG